MATSHPTPILLSLAIPPASWRDGQTGDALRLAHSPTPWAPPPGPTLEAGYAKGHDVEADNQELAT